MTKAIGYIRVSTEEQAQHGYSLDAQAESIRNYCKALGWEFINVYRDDGYSASSLDRPALQQLIADIPLHSFDTVVSWKLDMLSRSPKDTLYLLEDVFEKNGITFVSVQEPFVNTKDPTSKMFTTILAAFVQQEREMITEKMKM